MARASCNTNVKNVVPLNLILFRQYSCSIPTLKLLNWRIIRSTILCKNASTPERIATFQGAKSCSRIIYCDGYLIVKDVSTSNTLKVYNLNGIERKPFLKCSSIVIQDEWKDRSFGIGPIYSADNIPFKYGFKSALYFITARHLHFLNFHSRVVSNSSITLPEGYRFSELAVDNETHTLAVSSIKNPKSNVLMVFAMYEYYPQLIFIQLLQIQKSAFGATIVGAEINQGVLLTLHKYNRIKIYSLAAVCHQQESAPPVLFDIVTFNHILAIGAGINNTYYLVKATRVNTFHVQSLDDEKQISNPIKGKEHSFDPYLGFHPDGSLRLIFSDCGNFQLFDITIQDRTPFVFGGVVHSLSDEDEASNINSQISTTTTTASGRTVRRPVSSSVYSRTSDDDEMIHLAWDYEDDLDLLGVLYARQEEGRHSHIKLFLDLIDSPTGKRLRRMELDSNIRISSFESIEVFLRLDADQCLISIARNSRVSILVFRFVASNGGNHMIC